MFGSLETLTRIPEPTTIALLIAGVAAVTRRRESPLRGIFRANRLKLPHEDGYVEYDIGPGAVVRADLE